MVFHSLIKMLLSVCIDSRIFEWTFAHEQ